MTTKATVGQYKIRLGTEASPPQFNDIEEVRDIGGVGITNALVDVTSFDSGGSKEYVGGLADGVEVTIKCNRVPDESPPTEQQNMIEAVKAKETRIFELADTSVSPERSVQFLAVCKDVKLSPSVTDANSVEFVIKISGVLDL